MRTLSNFLPAGGQLLAQARQLRLLEKALRQLLPGDLADHCRIQNLRGTTLYLEVDSPIWANRLRYLLPALPQKMQKLPGLQSVINIELAVVPRQESTVHTRHVTLSSTAAQLILDSAEATSDPQLQAALRRLAENGLRRR